MHRRIARHTVRRLGITALAVVLPVSAVSFGATDAGAITGGPAAPVTLPATDTPMWQTNGAVWALAYSNGIVFAGGEFTSVRPPGVAAGTGQDKPMQRLAAFDAASGAPCIAPSPCPNGFALNSSYNIDSKVLALAVTPNGRKLFVGGDLNSKVAAFDLSASGATKMTTWRPGVTGQVRALAANDSELYVGGAITAPNPKVASFAIPATGLPTLRSNWKPVLSAPTNSPNNVNALLVGPHPDAVVLGGTFRTVNGVAQSGITQLYRSNGEVLPVGQGRMPNNLIPGVSGTTRSDVKALSTDGENIFVGAEGSGYGMFDGQASVKASTGVENWRSHCLGATQALVPIGPTVYIGSHTHDCTRLASGGMGQTPFANDPSSWHHLIAQEKDGNGKRDGSPLRAWSPTTNASPNNPPQPNELGPRAMTTDGTNLWVGGQFSKVNGRDQQGMTSFKPLGNGQPPTAPKVTAMSPEPGKTTVRWTGSSDPDDKFLTYSIFRGPILVGTVGPVASPWWQSPVNIFRDTGVPAGTHTYSVTVTDAHGLTNRGSAPPVSSSSGLYLDDVKADNPSLYWRLGEASGKVVADSSGKNTTGTAHRGVTRGQQGAIADNAAAGTASDALISPSSATATAPPASFSVEAWIKTAPNERNGGRIIGWGNRNASSTSTTVTPNLSTTPDRVLYMQNGGQLTFSIFTKDGSTSRPTNRFAHAGTCYLWSPQSYNDGSWHHVVATQDATSIRLYVDGVQVGSQALTAGQVPRATAGGFWRIGVDTMTGLPLIPRNKAMAGAIDEVAVYPAALNKDTVQAHFQGAE